MEFCCLSLLLHVMGLLFKLQRERERERERGRDSRRTHVLHLFWQFDNCKTMCIALPKKKTSVNTINIHRI